MWWSGTTGLLSARAASASSPSLRRSDERWPGGWRRCADRPLPRSQRLSKRGLRVSPLPLTKGQLSCAKLPSLRRFSMAADLFVLSSSGDPAGAARLADALARLGFGTWLAARDADPRSDLDVQMVQALRSVRAVAISVDAGPANADAERLFRQAKNMGLSLLAVTQPGAAPVAGADATILFSGLTLEVVDAAMRQGSSPATPAGIPPMPGVGSDPVPIPPVSVNYPRPGAASSRAATPADYAERYMPADGRGYWAAAFICANMASMLVQAKLAWDGYNAAKASDMTAVAYHAYASDGYVIWQVIGVLIALLPFLMWFHQTYKNLEATGVADTPRTPGQATGGFFIPLVNIVNAYSGLQTLWKGSSPAPDPHDPDGWKSVPGSFLVGIWVTGWVASGILERFLSRLTADDPNASAEVMQSRLTAYFLGSVFSNLLATAAGVAIVILILSIVKRQRLRYERYAREVAGIVPVTPSAAAWPIAAGAGSLFAIAILGLGFMNAGAPATVWKDVADPGYQVSLPEDFDSTDEDGVEEKVGGTLTGSFDFVTIAQDTRPIDFDAMLEDYYGKTMVELGEPQGEPVPFQNDAGKGIDIAFKPKPVLQPGWTEGHMRLFITKSRFYYLVSQGKPGAEFAKDNERFMASFRPQP
ncbi:DUF4328 domain-containing protein [bacterium]|nr:MAG: DUF4328 domain-containing protein [bacterium]